MYIRVRAAGELLRLVFLARERAPLRGGAFPGRLGRERLEVVGVDEGVEVVVLEGPAVRGLGGGLQGASFAGEAVFMVRASIAAVDDATHTSLALPCV